MWTSIEEFCGYVCDNCTANDWYCPTDCKFLEKAKRYPIERINKAYEDCGEDEYRLYKRIKDWR